MKDVKLSNKEILIICEALERDYNRCLRQGVSSFVELKKVFDFCSDVNNILEKLSEAVPNE